MPRPGVDTGGGSAMSKPIRVLLVDDSATIRKLLSRALSAHSEIEIVGTAANGIIALDKIMLLEPDAVILDVEMPEMNGLVALAKLRETHPRLPVIMFTQSNENSVAMAVDALAAGASDYVLKPSARDGETLELLVKQSLLPKLVELTRVRANAPAARTRASVAPEPPQPNLAKAATAGQLNPKAPAAAKPTPGAPARASSPTGSPSSSSLPAGSPFAKAPAIRASSVFPTTGTGTGPRLGVLSEPAPATTISKPIREQAAGAQRSAAQAPPVVQTRVRKPVQIVVIASSTGGPNALDDVLSRLPKQMPVPILVVQHMPPLFTRVLAERLNSRAELRVLESAGGELLAAGNIYIAPGNRHLELQRTADGVRTMLTDGPHENSCRPAADVLFRSVARIYGGATLAVVLTGMGQDGARGAREIYDAGGRVLVQSGPTCVIWGMPKAVEEAGLAEAVVPLPEMASAILLRVGSGLLPMRNPEERR
ncbi:MAG: two-component system, chemotaxis family, response regulator CheB [Myxococcaceae bacterium]|nr:two-component system, chemotaxis family, response regulator CheB [Myxococcaceae bacterium]